MQGGDRRDLRLQSSRHAARAEHAHVIQGRQRPPSTHDDRRDVGVQQRAGPGEPRDGVCVQGLDRLQEPAKYVIHAATDRTHANPASESFDLVVPGFGGGSDKDVIKTVDLLGRSHDPLETGPAGKQLEHLAWEPSRVRTCLNHADYPWHASPLLSSPWFCPVPVSYTHLTLPTILRV